MNGFMMKSLFTIVIISMMVTTTYAYGGSSSNGGVTTSNIDPYSNIAKYEVRDGDLSANKSVEYNFTTLEIGQISVNSKTNEYGVTVRIEELKNTSKYAKTSPGIVYKNENFWISTTRINYIGVKFRVNNSWLKENNITDDRLPYLLKWNGSVWLILKTDLLGRDDNYTYFESPKAGNSRIGIFAISSPLRRIKNNGNANSSNSEISVVYKQEKEEPPVADGSAKKVPGFDIVLFGISMLFSALYVKNRQRQREMSKETSKEMGKYRR